MERIEVNVSTGKREAISLSPEEIAKHAAWSAALEAEHLPAATKAECERRIFAVASRNTQMNLAAEQARLSASDRAAYFAGLDWIKATRATCADLIRAGETDFKNNPAWPQPSAAIVALARQY